MPWNIYGDIEVFKHFGEQWLAELIISSDQPDSFSFKILKQGKMDLSAKHVGSSTSIELPKSVMVDNFLEELRIPTGSIRSYLMQFTHKIVDTSIQNVFHSCDEVKHFFVKMNEKLFDEQEKIPEVIIDQLVELIDFQKPCETTAKFFKEIEVVEINDLLATQILDLINQAYTLDQADTEYSRCLYKLFLKAKSSGNLAVMVDIFSRVSCDSVYIFDMSEDVGELLFINSSEYGARVEEKIAIVKQAIQPLFIASFKSAHAATLLSKCLEIIAYGKSSISNNQLFDVSQETATGNTEKDFAEKFSTLMIKMAEEIGTLSNSPARMLSMYSQQCETLPATEEEHTKEYETKLRA